MLTPPAFGEVCENVLLDLVIASQKIADMKRHTISLFFSILFKTRRLEYLERIFILNGWDK